MGDEDGGEAELALEALDLDLHVQTESLVERAERLVEQQHGGLDGERAGHGDALLLASGELAREAITELGEAHDLEELVHRLPDLRALNAARLQAIRDVVGHRHVREERVALEDDPDVAEVGRQVIDGLAVDPNRPRALPHEPGHHAQQRRLAAAGRAEQRDDLAGSHGQRHLGDGGDRAVAVGHQIDVEGVAVLANHAPVVGRKIAEDYSTRPT